MRQGDRVATSGRRTSNATRPPAGAQGSAVPFDYRLGAYDSGRYRSSIFVAVPQMMCSTATELTTTPGGWGSTPVLVPGARQD